MTIVTRGAASFTTAAGSKTVAGTPKVGELNIIVVANTGYTAQTPPTDNNPDGFGTYTLINSCLKATSADIMQVYVRNALIGVNTATNYTETGVGSTGGGLGIFAVSGLVSAGLPAIRQSAIQSNQALSTTPTPVLALIPLPDSGIIGAVFNDTNPAGVTARASYTEISNVGYITPTTGLETMVLNSGETSASIAWASTSATEFCSLAIEINAKAAMQTNNYQFVRAGSGISVSEKIK